MKNGRIESIDIFRGVGIIIMVMGHINFGHIFDYYIHAFHMPMFYFISGMFFKVKSVEKTKVVDYATKKACTLLIPYAFFGIFHYLIWLKQNLANGETDLYAPLFHLLSVNTQGLPIAGALWFLTSLFLTEMIYFVLTKIIKNKVVFHLLIAVLALVGNMEMNILSNQLPFALGASLVGVGLFDIAQVFFSKGDTSFVRRMLNMSIIMTLVSVLITTALIFFNGYVNMRTGEYANIPLFWINAISSIIIGINISGWLDRILPNLVKCILTFIGKNSIVYVCLNQLVIMYIHMFIPETNSNKVLWLLFTLIILGICSFIINTTLLRKTIGR